MKLNLSILALLIISINAKAQSTVKNNFSNELSKPAAIFEENKGQMKDQHWKPRPDVLFYGSQAGMHYYIKNNGVSFQLSRVDSWREEDGHAGMPGKEKRQVPDQISTYRVDAHWISHNPDFDIERGKALDGYNNYYNVPDGADTALFVKQYEHVTLKNVWNGIDIHYYGTEGLLETDYLVSPGGDYSQIQMEIKGADLSISKDGHLIMKTPFGEIQEGELKVYQSDERLQAFWQIDDNNKVSFFIPNFNPALAMRIDPVTRVWGTYYGGLGDDYCNSIVTDALRNVYLAGKTSSTSAIASGGHQNTFGANTDAFLVKLDSIGVRQWGTYYGGTAISNEEGLSTTSDASGNIFLAGNTCCISNGIASGGHQNTSGGNSDAFLVKFSNNGVRQWGTYYGGSGNDYGLSTASDVSGNVYLAGHTVSPNAIASGGHQNTFGGGTADAFLVKFNSFGVRLWGTYYGGSSDEIFSSVSVSSGYVYLAGLTGSTTNIASGGHQNTYAGGPNMGDAYLVKFNSNGVRQWGTYYGGSGADIGYSTTTDFVGNVYLAGYTTSTSNIAAGGHQNTITGNSQSAFLVKFNSNGVRQWGTYYGGQNGDFGYSTCTDALGNVFLAGIGGSSPSLIASGGIKILIWGEMHF
ncbi:MAG: SBBP repeat-containing protein [Bacteroidetes bacterium]|nr:SBBP repeat-containing protein [Bacteroidota bacterium]